MGDRDINHGVSLKPVIGIKTGEGTGVEIIRTNTASHGNIAV